MKRVGSILAIVFLIGLQSLFSIDKGDAQQNQLTETPIATPNPTISALVDSVKELDSLKDTARTISGWSLGIGTGLAILGIGGWAWLKGQYDKKLEGQTQKYEQKLAEQELKYEQLLKDAYYKIDPRRTRIQIPSRLQTEIQKLRQLEFNNLSEYDDASDIDVQNNEKTIIVFHIPGSQFSEGTSELENAARLLNILDDIVKENIDNHQIGFVLYVYGRLNQASYLPNQYYNVVFANSPATLVARIYDLARMLKEKQR